MAAEYVMFFKIPALLVRQTDWGGWLQQKTEGR